MKLHEYLDEELIVPDLKSTTKNEVLKELVQTLGSKFNDFDVDQAYQVLKEREQLGSTGVGDNVAIPHGKMITLDNIMLVVGRSKKGVDFASLDFKPCHIFFLVLAPEQVAGLHLRILAHVSRLLREESFRREFIEAEGKEELWNLLKDA